jgi:hypothetical protein
MTKHCLVIESGLNQILTVMYPCIYARLHRRSLMTKVDYNEAVMGSIDFQFSFKNSNVSRHTIVQLIDDVIKALNDKYKGFDDENIDAHFHLENIEDEVWYELNGLIHEAYKRWNKEKPPLQVIHDYLSATQLDRFSVLTDKIAKEKEIHDK